MFCLSTKVEVPGGRIVVGGLFYCLEFKKNLKSLNVGSWYAIIIKNTMPSVTSCWESNVLVGLYLENTIDEHRNCPFLVAKEKWQRAKGANLKTEQWGRGSECLTRPCNPRDVAEWQRIWDNKILKMGLTSEMS